MNKYYDEILNTQGAEELHALIARWENLANNLKGRTFGAPIVLPDIIMYTGHGFGNSALLCLLAEYLDSKRVLMDFSGDMKSFEFAISYCPPEVPFSELTRLMDSVKKAAGYRNEFKGVVRIAMDQWVGHHSDKYFFELMEYLSAHTDNWMIVMTISREPDDKTRALEATASMFLRTEVIHIHMPDSNSLAGYAGEYLKQYGISLDESALDLLTGSIEKLRNARYFQSYHTVEMLCNDIVYYVMSEPDASGTVLVADDLRAFSADGDYIKKTEQTGAKRVKLGFRPD